MLCGVACVRAIHRRRTDQVWQVFFDRRRAATRTRVRYTFFYFIHTHCGAAHHLYNYKNYACAQTNRFNDCMEAKKKLCVYKNIWLWNLREQINCKKCLIFPLYRLEANSLFIISFPLNWNFDLLYEQNYTLKKVVNAL